MTSEHGAPDPSLAEQSPPTVVLTRGEYFARWSQLHGGVDPTSSPLIRGWLTIAHTCAYPMVRLGMSPNAVTLLGLVVAIGVPVLAAVAVSTSMNWLWVALVVTVLSGLLDSLDGAVAVMTGRTSDGGFVLDSAADRLSDTLLFSALWIVAASATAVPLSPVDEMSASGSPGPVVTAGWVSATALAAILLAMLQEYIRARAAIVGVDEIEVVSVSERPTRIIIVSVFLGLAAWAPYSVATQTWAWIGLLAAALVGFVGVLQVGRAVFRRLSLSD